MRSVLSLVALLGACHPSDRDAIDDTLLPGQVKVDAG
jgi:hypothetical protein